MTGDKIITMRLGQKIIEADIDFKMSEDAIYKAMRSQMAVALEGHQFIIWDPKHNRKARLHFDELNPTILYEIIPSHERTQGAGTLSGASQKTAQKLAQIRAHWNLDEDIHIFPDDIAPCEPRSDGQLRHLTDDNLTPLRRPELWSTSFTEKLRMLSVRSQNRHGEVMALVMQEVEARHNRETNAVVQVVSQDLVAATRKWEETMQQQVVNVPAAVVPEQQRMLAQRVNYELVETEEDRQANELFGGGLREAAEQALGESEKDGGVGVSWEYDQEGKFMISTHFR
jgi:hypothetical protein